MPKRLLSPLLTVSVLAGCTDLRGLLGASPATRAPDDLAIGVPNMLGAPTTTASIAPTSTASIAPTPNAPSTLRAVSTWLGQPTTRYQFLAPTTTAMDASGNLYIADSAANCIRKVTPAGEISTLAGKGTFESYGYSSFGGFTDGTGMTASFFAPMGLTIDEAGNLYVADAGNETIRKVTPEGVVTTLTRESGGRLFLGSITSIARDPAGGFYVTSTDKNQILHVSAQGLDSTFAGSGKSGLTNGTGFVADFNAPRGIAVASDGTVYVADTGNHCIRKITPQRVVTTFAGGAAAGATDGTGTAATMNAPRGLALDAAGNLYVADSGNRRLRKITPQGVVTTLAGSGTGGYLDGVGDAVRFASPSGLCLGRDGNLYVADSQGANVRKVTPQGAVSTVVSSTYADGDAAHAKLYLPSDLAMDRDGNVYVTDTGNNRVRKVTPEGIVTTLAGNGLSSSADGTGLDAGLPSPRGMAVDSQGNVFVAAGNRICKITPQGVVTTFAGSITGSGYADGTGTQAKFSTLQGLAVDAADNLYVADNGNYRIRKVTPIGVVTTLAGSGTPGSVDGPGTTAQLGSSGPLAVDAGGNVLLADSSYHRIRKITPQGIVSTVTLTNVDGVATNAPLSQPNGIVIDASGNMYVSDSGHNRILKVTPQGAASTIAGSLDAGYADGLASKLNYPRGLLLDGRGRLLVADRSNHCIRVIP